MQLLSYPQSLEDADDPRHNAELTDVGKAKLRDREPGKPVPELHPSIDYKVKDGGADWLAYPD